MNIVVVGLGRLGLPLAALHAKKHRVYGIDINPESVKAINDGRSLIREPNLAPLLKKVVDAGKLTAHTDYSLVTGTDISLVIVPTPSLENGAFTSKHVLKAVAQIGKAIADQPNRHVVVICSTVMPGECENSIWDALEVHSRKTIGEDVGLVFSPEFVALGSVLHDMENPAFSLIGESDDLSGKVYEKLVPKGKPVRHMSLTSAEVAKLSLNAYVTMKISFANTLGEVCENIPGADAHAITAAIGLDPRIGSAYFTPGGPSSGPCFPRDSRAFAVVGKRAGIPMPLAVSTDVVNERQIARVIKHIAKVGRNTVGIMGLTYKPGAPVFEESFGINLALELYDRDYQVKVYDPLAQQKPDDLLLKGISWSIDPYACFGNDVTTVIANPDRRFLKLFPDVFEPDARNRSIVIDCWGFLPSGPWEKTHIIRMGIGEQCS